MKKSTWKGYDRYDFSYNGREGLVVAPAKPAEGNPWIWRAEYFDAFAQADMAMLEQGWHLAYYDVSGTFGGPEPIRWMRSFQSYAESEFQLAKKTVLFGFSRGGLYSFNYAAEYPEQVSGLYLDAPALDIRSWPGGYGEAERSEKAWQECLREYGVTEETLSDFQGSPLDRIEPVAKAGIPIIVVSGDADKAAIYSENTEILVRRYRELGGPIESIVKPGGEHHPHSLEDPAPIVEFLVENCKAERD